MKYLKGTALVLTIIVLLSVMPFSVSAAENSKNEKRLVRVAYPEQTYLTEIDETGSYYGYSYEYLKKVAEFANWQLEYVTFSDESLDEQIMSGIESIQSGEADIMGVMLRSDALEEQFEYPERNYGAVYTTLDVLEDNFTINETNYMRTENLRIAILETAKTRNAELEDFVKTTKLSCEYIYCSTVDEQVQALKDGRADAMLKVSLSFLPELKQIAQFAPRPYYFVSTKGNTEIIAELDAAIEKINITDPYYENRLRSKYFVNKMADFSLSDAEKGYVNENKQLDVLVIPDYAPFAFVNTKGELCGMAVSILNDIADKTGLTIDYHILEKSEDIEGHISTEKYDIVLGPPGSNIFAEKNGLVLSRPFLDESLTMFVNKNSIYKAKADSILALVKDVTEPIGSYEYKEIHYYDTIKDCLEAVNNGDADYGYGNRYIIDFYSSENNYNSISLLFLSGYNREVGFYVPNTKESELLSIINKYVRSMPTKEIHGHLSMALSQKDYSGIDKFIQDNPLVVITVSVAFLFLILSIIMLTLFNNTNKQRNKKLQIAFSAKSDFLSRMSHDMRTPMNGIIGLTGLTLEEKNLPAEVSDNLTKIKESAQYLLSLINDTLDMNKIESNKIVLNKVPTNLNSFFEQMISVVKISADQKDVTLVVSQNDKEMPLVSLDRVRVQQILLNLASNAIKFTPENGTVEIAGECQKISDSQVATKITVKDTGIGIDQNFLPKIFEPFEQESTSATTNYGGTGLGLAIVKNLVDIMGGTVSVKSQKNVGSEFVVDITFDVTEVQEEPKTFSSDSEDCLDGKRILLCEDHPLNAQIATKLLEKKNIIVEHAENGKIATEIFAGSEIGYYDALLMDIRMPVMDGLTATKTIREMDRSDAKSVPIIAMTANAFDEDVQKSSEAGMSAHLAKPIEPEKLYSALRSFL